MTQAENEDLWDTARGQLRQARWRPCGPLPEAPTL